MKSILAIVFAAILAWFLVFQVSDDSERSYVVIKSYSDSAAKDYLDLTLIQKLPADVTCLDFGQEGVNKMIKKLQRDCPECRASKPVCKDELTELYRRAFDNQSLTRPYFSYDKGWNFGGESFRIFLDSSNSDRAAGICEELRKILRNEIRFFLNGHFGCIY